MSWQPSEKSQDDQLLARYRRDPVGEEGRRAAGTLLGSYRGRVYVWCQRMMRNHDEALDLAQVTLLKAWRALPSFGDRSRFSSWLFTIARNECLTALRPRTLRRDPDADPAWFLVDHDEPGVLLESREEEEALNALIRDTLNPTEQVAVWLRCFEGLSVDEVTRILGLETASGARSVLQSAREKLRRALQARKSRT